MAHDHGPPHTHSSEHAPAGSHSHGHAHGHAHGHGHAARSTRAFAIGVALNFAIVLIESVYGVIAHSMALLADAGHNLGDVLGLVLTGLATLLAKRAPTLRRTYGLRRLTLLSALANGLVLLVSTGGIAWESIRRLQTPEPVDARIVMIVAAIGMVVNGASALLFYRDRDSDLNMRAAFIHLAGDAAIALGVVASSFIVMQTGWQWLDPVTSLVIAALILVSTWSLLRRSTDLVLDAVPEGIDVEQVRAYLAHLPKVGEVHDLHIWAMSTTETALTAHLVVPGNSCEPAFLSDVCKGLNERFGIAHSTLQLDPADAPAPCSLASDEVV